MLGPMSTLKSLFRSWRSYRAIIIRWIVGPPLDAAESFDVFPSGEDAVTELREHIESSPEIIARLEQRRAEAQKIEEAAKLIYAEMAAANPVGYLYPWVEGGNSLKQDEAREKA